MTAAPTPPDRAAVDADRRARLRLATHTAGNVFVSAGAGSGKTTALVDRVTSLVIGPPALGDEDGQLRAHHWARVGTEPVVPLDRVAVVTFTEKAAGELVHRLRARFDEIGALPDAHPDVTRRAGAALAVLDQAPVGTLHAFGRRLLQTVPVEAGLPPRLEVFDEFASAAHFAAAWDEVWRDLLDAATTDEWLAWGLDHLLGERGVKPDDLGRLYRRLDRARVAAPTSDGTDLGGWVRDRLVAWCTDAADAATLCLDDDGALRPGLARDQLAAWLTGLGQAATAVGAVLAAEPEGTDVLRAVTELLPEPCPRSKAAKSWEKAGRPLDDVLPRARAADPSALVDGLALAVVAVPLATAAHARAAARIRAGLLTYDDLLTLSVDLLRRDPRARRRLHALYDVVLLDEFQDTDPLQIELAVRLLADDHDPDRSWAEHAVPPGRLGTVGDPKQSIYRFRDADIATFLATERWLTAAGAERLALARNFRSHPAVLDFLNALFGRTFVADGATQAAYEPLLAGRGGDDLPGPVVHLLGTRGEPSDTKPTAAEVQAREAADVADAVAAALGRSDEPAWQVLTDGHPRAAKAGDVAVLIPARSFLPALESALTARGLAYQVEGSGLLYETREVRGLLAVLRAVDAPTDGLAVVHALRSTVLGCSDEELARHRFAGGRFEVEPDGGPASAATPAPGHPRVVAALGQLAGWAAVRHVLDPGQLIDRIAEDAMVFEQAAPADDRRDRWRRLRAVAHQARAWSDQAGGSLRDYLAWIDQRRAAAQEIGGESREIEAVLAETDVDAVRVMTIHAAKGLEFPVVVVAGLSVGRPTSTGRAGVQPGDAPAGVEVALNGRLTTPGWSADPTDDRRQDDAELIRLLYVATTRAESHLVLSLHRASTQSRSEPLVAAWQELLAAEPGWEGRVDRRPPAAVRDVAEPVELPPLAPDEEAARAWAADEATFRAERAATLAAGGRRHTWSATAIATTLAGPLADAPATPLGGSPAGPLADAPVSATSAAVPRVAPADELVVDGPSDPGLEKQPRDLDQPASRKGRYGTQIGRAVHAVVQTIDLADADEATVAELAAWYAEAEGIGDLVAEVTDRVRSVLDSPLIARAAAADARGRAWRETYVGTVLADPDHQDQAGARPGPAPAVEGYLDLAFADEAGLVVVDVKTDRVDDDGTGLQERYGPQLTTYALALERATGQPVAETWLLVARPGREALALPVDPALHTAAVLGVLHPPSSRSLKARER